MTTNIIKLDPFSPDSSLLSDAVRVLSGGGLCAFPTETVYGLGANAWHEDAAKKIYAAKGRPSDNPLIVHIADKNDVYNICREVPDIAHTLMDKFWGGPLTIIMKKSSKVPLTVTAGLDTVAVRLPSHPVANTLIRMCGFPVAAPSANISGKPSPTVASHVIEDLSGKIECIIDGGNCMFGLESTVLDLTTPVPAILRPGAVTYEELCEVLGEVTYGGNGDIPKSPGMKYKHYSPSAPVYVLEGDAPGVYEKTDKSSYSKIGILNFGYPETAFSDALTLSAGETPADYAARLFYLLREFDAKGVDVIYAVPPKPGEISDAILNRLYKAAGGKTIK